MAYNQLITKNGHSLFTMSSLYQKAIRRCDVKAAGYAANELFDRYEHYLWKRTLVISAEDCYGECTQEILALYWASQEVNKGKKGNDRTRQLPFCCTTQRAEIPISLHVRLWMIRTGQPEI